MKKSILFFLLSIMTICSVRGQIVEGEVFAGFNLSQVDGDQVVGFKKPGVHLGVGAIVPFYQHDKFRLSAELEVLFSQKGAHQKAQYKRDEQGRNGAYDLNMGYVEVPLLVRITDGKRIASAALGVSYGRLVALSEYEHDHDTKVVIGDKRNDSSMFCRHDLCFVADVSFRIYQRLKLGFRYQYSLMPLREKNWINMEGKITDYNVTQFNNTVTVRFVWNINENREKLLPDDYQYTGDNPYFHNKAVERQLRKTEKKIKRMQEKEEKERRKAEEEQGKEE